MDAPLLFMSTIKQSQPHRRQYKQVVEKPQNNHTSLEFKK